MNILITGAFGFAGANLSKAPESLGVGEAPLGFRLKFGHQRMASLFFPGCYPSTTCNWP
jgi:hypothetical protein